MTLRILFASDFLDPDDIGGSGRLLLSVGQGLVERGHTVGFLTGSTGSSATSFTHEGVEYPWHTFAYARTGRRGAAFLARTARAIRAVGRSVQAHYDVVVPVQPLVAAALGRLTCPGLYLFLSPWPLEYLAERCGSENIRDVARLHWRGRLACAARRWVERRAVCTARGWVTISETSARHLSELYGVDRAHLRVAHLGVDTARFAPVTQSQRRALRRALDVPDGTLLICCVRRLVPRTGVDLLLEALGRPELAHLRVQLLIAGRGKSAALWESRARTLGLGDRVRFLGYVADAELPDLYRAADVCAVPTRALEGFGLATVEALACGTPVVATPVGGSVEILGPLDARLLTDGVSAQALAEKLREWSDLDRLQALRATCRDYAVQTFSWQAMTDAIESEAARLAPRAAEAPARLPHRALRPVVESTSH